MKYEGVTCGLAIERPAPAVVLIRLTGWDTGEWIMRLYTDASVFDAALYAARAR